MAIRSRFTGMQQDSELPAPLKALFQQAASIGDIFDRPALFGRVLPKHEATQTTYRGYRFSVRPSWTAYVTSPRTHVIVNGQILFCHVFERTWIYQPSTRLFANVTMDNVRQLIRLADHMRSCYGTSNCPYDSGRLKLPGRNGAIGNGLQSRQGF
jgi:hypothetical protein